MSSPRNLHSVEDASGTETGEQTRANGHVHITLFAAAAGLDSANDTLTVVLEGSPDGTHWTNVGEANAKKKLSESDFSEDPDNAGVFTASVSETAAYHEFYRARVSDYTDAADGDLEVDAWVLAGGNAGSGQRGQPDGP